MKVGPSEPSYRRRLQTTDETIEDFERNLKGNLYKVWNRMSSGSYFPPVVRRVLIPKANGGKRALGILTVADRVAQMVVKKRMEPLVEPLFHSNSFGYRPGIVGAGCGGMGTAAMLVLRLGL